MPRLWPVVLLAVPACTRPQAVGPAPPGAPAAAVVTLPPGTRLRIPPVTVVGTAQDGDVEVISGLLREALRLSARLDFAAGIEDCGGGVPEVHCHLDREGGTLTTTLVESGRAPLALAAAAFTDATAAGAIVRLAAATRAALGDPAEPTTAAAVYSESRACVLATERALAAAVEGELEAARSHLADARRADAGCTVTLLATAELDLRKNDFARAVRVAQEALQLENRCAPTTRHRLARTLLLARAATTPGEAPTFDRQLLALGEAAQRERPHDPHGAWTRAQALALLGRFSEAEPILAALRERWPRLAQVPYHHALALLGCGRAPEALAALDQAQAAHSPLQTAVPRAIALWGAGRHEDLKRFLAELAERDDVRTSPLLHHVRRMQAAHAILTDRGADAAQLLLADLEWLRQRTSRLAQHADDLASTGHVLVLLGRAADVTRAVDAFLRLPHVDEAARRALTFAGGLAAVATTRAPAEIAEASLGKEGASAWTYALRAAAHRARGELAEETRALLQAAQLDRSPLLRASLARVLRTAGEEERARELLAALRTELLRLDLRRLKDHPLVDPAHALALLATR